MEPKQLPSAQSMGLKAHSETGLRTVASGLAQRESSQVQAQLFAALQRPRDEKSALDKILNACSRESLAAVAQYSYAKGGTSVDGPSIKLAQAIAMHWGNIEAGWREIDRHKDEKGTGVSVIEAYCWDIESNYRVPRIFSVPHWRDTKQGGYAITDERDIYELCANMASRRVRACILSVIPGDIVDEAMNQCHATLSASADTSPEAQTRMLASFDKLGVTKAQIEEFIQRRIDAITAAQVMRLRNIHNSIRDGMSEPADWFKGKHQAAGESSAKARTEEPSSAPAPAKAEKTSAPKDLF